VACASIRVGVEVENTGLILILNNNRLIISKMEYLINGSCMSLVLFRAKAQRSKDAKEDQEKSMLFW
jgi:hypothetical protein